MNHREHRRQQQELPFPCFVSALIATKAPDLIVDATTTTAFPFFNISAWSLSLQSLKNSHRSAQQAAEEPSESGESSSRPPFWMTRRKYRALWYNQQLLAQQMAALQSLQLTTLNAILPDSADEALQIAWQHANTVGFLDPCPVNDDSDDEGWVYGGEGPGG